MNYGYGRGRFNQPAQNNNANGTNDRQVNATERTNTNAPESAPMLLQQIRLDLPTTQHPAEIKTAWDMAYINITSTNELNENNYTTLAH